MEDRGNAVLRRCRLGSLKTKITQPAAALGYIDREWKLKRPVI
jgi:hypothetical protein